MTTKIEVLSVEQAPKSRFSRLIWVTPLAMLAATAPIWASTPSPAAFSPKSAPGPAPGPAKLPAPTSYLLLGAMIFAVIAGYHLVRRVTT